ARPQRARDLRRQLLTVQQVSAGQPRLAASSSLRGPYASLPDQREAAVLEHSQLADDAVAAAVLARSARAEAQLVALDAERVGELERLGRSRERVRHRHVHAGRPIRVRTRALAATDGLVVREAVVPEREVVHRPLALRGHGHGLAEGREDDVHYPARGLDIPGGHGRRGAGIEERALLRQHAHRYEG